MHSARNEMSGVCRFPLAPEPGVDGIGSQHGQARGRSSFVATTSRRSVSTSARVTQPLVFPIGRLASSKQPDAAQPDLDLWPNSLGLLATDRERLADRCSWACLPARSSVELLFREEHR